ncbi:MAG: DUF2191 domain-containing protein [Gammaproteobacteria bacterium]|nr:DUF2191 domain-containing protein [Gammaproteobacteria bacterium]MDJ0871023.1 DUF2191 domain-containing protein [Gammaproteobacteria bacterium]MDJ0892816.1 DUF2191 domain-containing protein [Gammaproteobacteria bacterium]
MRTTLTIDDDVAQTLKDLSRKRGTSFEAVVNEVLRGGLTSGEKPSAAREPFRVRSAPRGFRAGIDPRKLNQLVDELEIERFMAHRHWKSTRT